MSDLDLVRDLYPERAVDHDARERVRSAVAARTVERRHPAWLRQRRLVPALGTVAAAVAVASAVFLFTGTRGTDTAAAARVLRQAAVNVRQEPGLTTLGPGQYLYTRSTSEYLSTYALKSGAFSVVVPYTREVWLRRDGTGWLHQVAAAPRFIGEQDRQAWIDAGKPSLDGGSTNTALRNSDGPTPPMSSLDLPADPDALYTKLHQAAAGFGDRTNAEMFIIIGDDLRENYTTPAQRAALFEVAARIPGIQLVPDTRDAAGRPADAVSIDDGSHHERLSLLFDPQTRALLGESDAVLGGNELGYPAGTVIGSAAYLEQKVVDAVPSSVANAAKH
jgi:RNA polymerase sigma-70 factor (ECF subfamily)